MFLLPLILQMLGANGAVAGALGSMGLSSGLASALAPGVIPALGTWAATGDPLKGLAGGLGGIGLGMLGGGANAASGAASAANGASQAAAASPGAASQAAAAAQQAQVAQAAAAGAMTQDPTRFAALGNIAPTANATQAAASGGMGGLMPWLVGGAALLPSLLGGGEKDDKSKTPPYQHATPVPRHQIGIPTQGTGTGSPSDYIPGDTSQNGTIWRYGQEGGPDGGGEHMWFDPVPNSSRPTLDAPTTPTNGHGTHTINLPGIGPVQVGGGGISDLFNLFSDGNPPGYALGGPVQVRPAPPWATPRQLPQMPWQPGQFSQMPGSFQASQFAPRMPGYGGPSIGPQPMGLGTSVPPMMQNQMMMRAGGGHVNGPGTGTSDSIPAMLSDGEYVIPADVVSALGAGSNNAGGQQLSDMMQQVRLQAQKQDQPRSMGLKVHAQ